MHAQLVREKEWRERLRQIGAQALRLFLSSALDTAKGFAFLAEDPSGMMNGVRAPRASPNDPTRHAPQVRHDLIECQQLNAIGSRRLDDGWRIALAGK